MKGGGTSKLSHGVWVAMIAGGAPWSNDDQTSSPLLRLVSLAEAFGYLATIVVMWRATALATEPVSSTPAVVCTLAVALLMVPVLLRAVGRHPLFDNVTVNFLARSVLISVVVLSLVSVLPGWNSLMMVSFAVALGADASLTTADLGWRPAPLEWWRTFLASSFHFGVLGALIAAVVLTDEASVSTATHLFIAMHASVAILVITAWIIASILHTAELDRRSTIADVVENERRTRAHWLHDDVCALLRLASLKVQTAAATPTEVLGMLDELDHQLRLRQLDELLDGGPVKVAEVIQPYIRRAQNAGAVIRSVPSFDEASVCLPESAARLLSRAASVLTSNALNASATQLTYAVSADEARLRLTVTDDGPGFSLSDVPLGRGLWSLMEDLRPGGIEISGDCHGSSVTALIPIGERIGRVHHSAR